MAWKTSQAIVAKTLVFCVFTNYVDKNPSKLGFVYLLLTALPISFFYQEQTNERERGTMQVTIAKETRDGIKIKSRQEFKRPAPRTLTITITKLKG